MKVSVLMPVYKTNPQFLREAIQSVLNQTFTDFEFLILDDCPADSRAAVVKEFNDSRIVYSQNERNLGISASRNKLIDAAKGEYLAVFDHDDICKRERLAKEVAYLDAHPDCGLVSSWTVFSASGSVNDFPTEDHEIKVAMMGKCNIWHPAAMIRKSVLEAHHLRYEEEASPVEDYKLWMRLIPLTRFANLPEPLLEYRWHKGNTSVVQREALLRKDLEMKAWAKVHLPELYEEYELRKTVVSRVKLFGIPFLKISKSRLELEVKLFNVLPFLKLRRKSDL